MRPCLPHGIPTDIDAKPVCHYHVGAVAACIDDKFVGGSEIAIGVEGDADKVANGTVVAPTDKTEYIFRIGVVTVEPQRVS